MPAMKTILAAAAVVLAPLAQAHFNLQTPPTIGFDDDNEGNGPCGGFTPSFADASKVASFHVGGEPVGMKLFHNQANWLFRATLDTTASGNWTQLFPIVQQSGLGLFCETAITAPASFVGKQGVLSVVANAPDGFLFQCATVNFVSGVGTVSSSTCSNGTITASFVGDSQLSALVSGSSSSGGSTTGGSTTVSSTTSSTSTTSTSPPTSSSTGKSAAAGLSAPLSLSGAGSLVTFAAMVMVGFALL
jgi:hypothetical protein